MGKLGKEGIIMKKYRCIFQVMKMIDKISRYLDNDHNQGLSPLALLPGSATCWRSRDSEVLSAD